MRLLLTALPLPTTLLVAALLFLFGGANAAHASGRASLSLGTAPDVIFADGKSTTIITATVRDSNGSPVSDGTPVRFSTTLGILTPDTATTTSGVARVSLTSTSSAGDAALTATAFSASADGSSIGTAHVEFTTDRESLFAQDARWIRLDCPQYLIYSADTKIAEAQGKKGSAHLEYKSLDIAADSLQVDLLTQTVLAHQAVMQRGRHVLRVAELRYDLVTGSGTAILSDGASLVSSSVTITGYALETAPQPLDAAQSPLLTNPYRFVDLSDSKVVISARAITAAPGDQVQFRRASIYSEGKKILSMPYHVMPMNTDQLFGQQLLGFGSQGIFVNVPYYYNVTPHSKGTIFLRNSGVNGTTLSNNGLSSGSSFFGSHASTGGMALDLEQSYDFGRGGSGQLLVNGITRSQWGAQWTHAQRIDDSTHSYFFVDYPSHRSLFASSNLTRQFNGFSLNITASGSHDPGTAGYSASSTTINTYLQTNPRALGHSGISYTTDFTAQSGHLVESTPTTGQVNTPINNKGVDIRLFTAPIRPDKRTQITDSLTVGQVWSGSSSRVAPTVSASLGIMRTFRKSDSLSLNYTYRYDPLLSQVGTYSSALNPLQALLYSSTQQRINATYFANLAPRLSVNFSGGYGLPLGDRSLFASATYRVNDNWGLGVSTSYERYFLNTYQDTEYSVSRRFFGRDLVFYYSTKSKKLRFDFGGLNF